MIFAFLIFHFTVAASLDKLQLLGTQSNKVLTRRPLIRYCWGVFLFLSLADDLYCKARVHMWCVWIWGLCFSAFSVSSLCVPAPSLCVYCIVPSSVGVWAPLSWGSCVWIASVIVEVNWFSCVHVNAHPLMIRRKISILCILVREIGFRNCIDFIWGLDARVRIFNTCKVKSLSFGERRALC